MSVRRAWVAAVLVPLFLAGCAEEEPKPIMPDPPSATSTPTPTESEAPKPESAEVFIRRWVAAGDAMQITGDTAEYDAMTPNCRACQAFVKNVSEVYAGGGSAEFAGSTIVDIDLVGKKPFTLEVTKDLPETVIHEPSGDTRRLPGGRTKIRVTLGKIKGDWVVNHFGVL